MTLELSSNLTTFSFSSCSASSRSALAHLYSAGFPNIVDSDGQVAEVLDPTEPVTFDLRREEIDPLQGNLLVFQFLAFTRWGLWCGVTSVLPMITAADVLHNVCPFVIEISADWFMILCSWDISVNTMIFLFIIMRCGSHWFDWLTVTLFCMNLIYLNDRYFWGFSILCYFEFHFSIPFRDVLCFLHIYLTEF